MSAPTADMSFTKFSFLFITAKCKAVNPERQTTYQSLLLTAVNCIVNLNLNVQFGYEHMLLHFH